MHVEGHGGFKGGYEAGAATCGTGSALVGVDIRSGDRIMNLNGLCANYSQWTGTGAEPTITKLGVFGSTTTGGTLSVDKCPRGHFVGGWEVGTGFTSAFGTDTVHTLKLYCYNLAL